MLKYISSTVFICGMVLLAIAQPAINNKSPLAFRSIVTAGILEGQFDKTTAQFQMVNGVQKNTWFTGMGVGIDYYGRKRSVPLFVALEKDWWKNKKSPFVYVNGGYNFSWLRENEKRFFQGTGYSQTGGIFYELGLGYKFLLKNKMYLGFAAGYSEKRQSEKLSSPQFCTFCFPLPVPAVEEFNYTFKRISLKMNCWF